MTAKKPLELSSRPCMVDNVNPRTEKHGDDDVPAVDVKLSNIMLSKAELIRLTGDPQAWNLLFQQEKGTAPVEPTLQCFDGERYLLAKFEECASTIRFGMQKTEHEFDNHKIKGISCKAVVGGLTAVTLTIQQSLDDTRITGHLHEYQGKEAHVAITFGKISENEKRQKNLALNDEDDGDATSGRGVGDDPQPATH